MSEDKEKNKEEKTAKSKLGLKSSKLELRKTIDSGTVRQSFSHGRTKSVSVEIKKIRTYKPQNLSTDKKDNDLGKDKGKLDYKLSDEEKNARIKALDNASKKEIKEEVDEKQEETEKEIKNENIKQQDSPTK